MNSSNNNRDHHHNKNKGRYSKRGKREPQLVLWREMSQRTSPASLTIPCLPQQPCHTLLGPMSFDKKSGEGEQCDRCGVASPGAHRCSHLHHCAQAPTFPRLPSSTLDPKHCSQQWKEIFGVSQAPSLWRAQKGNIPTMAKAPAALLWVPCSSPSLPQPSPSSGTYGEHISLPTDDEYSMSSPTGGAALALENSPCPMQKCQSGCCLSAQNRALDAREGTHGISGHWMGGGRSE